MSPRTLVKGAIGVGEQKKLRARRMAGMVMEIPPQPGVLNANATMEGASRRQRILPVPLTPIVKLPTCCYFKVGIFFLPVFSIMSEH